VLSSAPPISTIKSKSPPTACPYKNVNIYTFTLKMATAMSAETLDKFQHSTRPIPENRSYTWRQYVSPKRWHLPTSLHGAKTQNNNIIILTAGKTTNLTRQLLNCCERLGVRGGKDLCGYRRVQFVRCNEHGKSVWFAAASVVLLCPYAGGIRSLHLLISLQRHRSHEDYKRQKVLELAECW
jgi:hypothetical protein